MNHFETKIMTSWEFQMVRTLIMCQKSIVKLMIACHLSQKSNKIWATAEIANLNIL